MNSDTPLDCAVFELSPRRSRCELFVSGNGRTEKIASGFLKPFITHLKVAEEQAARSDKSIKLEVERSTSGSPWFNKGTLERFVRFVSTPEVLESANTYDAEMSQLEGARRIYSQGTGDTLSSTLGEDSTASVAAADITKKELVRAIDVRLVTLRQDLATACARAFSAGFSIDNVSELLLFAEYFGANRLIEACNKFILLCQKHPEFIGQQQQSQSVPLHLKNFADGNIRSSSSSDMSIDEPQLEYGGVCKPHDGGDLQLHKSNISEQSQLNTTVLSGTSQQAKPIIRQRAVSEEPVSTSANEPAQQDSGGSSRRLSVQDRINLFENKQKEQSGSSRNISTVGVNRVAAGKGQHRRLSSDVSEKSVLRRWSGASDMSIDLTMSISNSFNDPKDGGSVEGTPTSTNLQLPLRSKTEEVEATVLKDAVTSQSWLDPKERTAGTSSSLQSQYKGFPGEGGYMEDEIPKFSITKVKPDLETGKYCTSASMGTVERNGLSDQDASRTHQKVVLETSNNDELMDPAAFHIQSKAEDHMVDEAALPEMSEPISAMSEQVSWRGQELPQARTREISSLSSRADGVGAKDKAKTVSQFRTFGRRTGAEVKEKGPTDSVVLKVSSDLSLESDKKTSQSQGKALPIKEEAGGRNAAASHVHSGFSPAKTKEDANNLGANLQRQVSVPDVSIDEITNSEKNRTPAFPLRKAKETQEVVESPSSRWMEQNQVLKPLKGNQELNDELRMKANELERLFAAHKHRTLSEHTSSSRRSRPVNVQEDHVPMAMDKRHAAVLPDHLPDKKSPKETSNNELEFDANFLQEALGTNEYGSGVNEKLDILSPSGDSRGKFYYKYVKKRDAKLLEEWGTKGAMKEAKMKAMLDSLELSQAEMTSRYSGSVGKQGSNYSHRRAERLSSFSKRATSKSKSQAVGSGPEVEDVEELYEQVGHGHNTSYYDPFDDNSSKITNSMKLLSTKTSSTPRTPVVSVPKPSAKSTKSVSTKHRSRTESTLAESVPNFSEFRKENAKPSAVTNRVNTREKTKNLSRSKSIIEEINLAKEDNPRRSQSMRKGAAIAGELKDLSLLNSDSSDLTPLGFDKAQKDATFISKAQKGGELKSLVRKGKGTAPGLGGNAAKPKASFVSEVNNNVEYSESIVQRGSSPDLDKDVLDRSSAEGDPEAADFPVDSDSEKPRHSQEYENSDDFVSEDGDFQRSLSQADYGTAPVSPKFDASAGNAQETPGQSPRSWNSHNHSFSYAHEASDIDAPVDSPIGSPASWTLHPLNQMEADAARMRKKWGSAQMPMIVANASQQSRKDVTKGFKRLLKFGRKSRGLESVVTDWVSASTASEGDDDIEDGRDLTMRPIEDSRKSRMGYSLPHDGFNEGEFFPDQAESLRTSIPNPSGNFKLREDHLTGSSLKAPRSFFSLSSFRSKESKPR
ncbi:hypothetical protein Cni_G01942 [Canna indica]|uniref:COP1-interacting protein 7 n=1 Tax=Canna indica TaxID=4628 RepID=A0AAQ3Q285_9LILI|nr:hypothetical protein Cni_G01942 [Canna indica]